MVAERSLVFLEVGHNRLGKEQGAGCAKVIQLVEALSNGGNQSVLGLVDWDGHRLPTKRIHVLSQGIRNAIESVLLDPRLLIAVICRERIDSALELGMLETGDTYASLSSWNSERWQIAVENLINAAETGGGWLMFARIGMMRALNEDRVTKPGPRKKVG